MSEKKIYKLEIYAATPAESPGAFKNDAKILFKFKGDGKTAGRVTDAIIEALSKESEEK